MSMAEQKEVKEEKEKDHQRITKRRKACHSFAVLFFFGPAPT